MKPLTHEERQAIPWLSGKWMTIGDMTKEHIINAIECFHDGEFTYLNPAIIQASNNIYTQEDFVNLLKQALQYRQTPKETLSPFKHPLLSSL